MITRRRFITVSAAAIAASPASASAVSWQGRALGAEVSLLLHGGTDADLAAAISVITEMEQRFSIYDPSSELSQLNVHGGGPVSAQMSEVLALCDHIHTMTRGLFDPTIQPVFRALLERRAPPWHLIGWHRVERSKGRIRLAEGQELTLNGIAQGYATEQVRQALEARGFTKAMVSVGEHAALGGPFRLSLEDPIHGPVGIRTLKNAALATSSPGAMRLGTRKHILHPSGGPPPHWSTVSVEAANAALADGLSTALCMAPLEDIQRVATEAGVTVTLVDHDGDVTTLG